MSDARRAVPLKTPDGKHGHWMIFCPACRHGHGFDSRWTFNGNEESPTFLPSMLVHEDGEKGDRWWQPRCHSFVTDGKIQFLPDSTHAMAGQTVELESVWGEDSE